jgi:hypothetical protein
VSGWITFDTIITNSRLTASRFQQWWQNLDNLKSPNMAGLDGPGPSNDWWTFTPTGVWTDIDATYYRLNLETFGNPITLVSRFQCGHSVASGKIYLTYEIDGIRYGNTNGLAYYDNQAAGLIAGVEMVYTLSLAAGVHEVVAQVYNVTAGDAKVWKNANLGIFALEY